MSISQLNAVQITNAKIASLIRGPRRNGAVLTLTVLRAAARTAARSNELAERWSDRNAAEAAFDACGGTDGRDGRRGGARWISDDSRSSTNTELPQFVQNDRVGSTRRPHDAHTIGRYSATDKIFCAMTI